MPADTAASHEPCPDPSVHHAHQHSSRLQEQASTAALYATQPDRAAEPRASEQPANVLDADGKLSSKSAAASLKHAKPQDLPSFPSSGNTANSASKAALLAKDYKMDPLWQPEQSRAGSKAALLAHGKGSNIERWQATATSDGHSAATLAMRNTSLSPKVDYGVNAENKNKALLAAAMSHNKGRQRAGSTPSPAPPAYPDSQNSTANALNAATASHRASTRLTSDGWDSQANQAARIKNSTLDPAMFGDRPPVEIEREEAKRQAALRASAVSMAKQIMETQDRTAMTADPADVAGAQAAAARTSTSAQPDIKQEAMRYINLQEAARKLAAEKMAKVDKNFESAQYREYYGYSDKPKRLSSRLSMRSSGGSGRQRKRASSEGTADFSDSDDEGQARRIRSQMSKLNSGLSKLDEKKQQDDRAKVLAAAEKSVSARMHKMDERVFADTGKVPPALMEEWEEKARQRAQQEREQQAQNPGKLHLGGGKFMDQSEIEAIAAARLKPTLDEINNTAEKRRARDEELRQEREEQGRQKREEKAKNREEKEEQKRIKKDEEKARKEEEKRVAKEERRKSRETKRDNAAAGAAGVALAEVAEKVKDDEEPAADDTVESVQKHRSTLSRLKSKFRRSHAGEAEREHRDQGTDTTAVEIGTATTSPEEDPLALDAQQAAHVVGEDEKITKATVASEPASAAEPQTPTAAYAPEHVDGDADDEEEVDKWKPVAVPTTAALTAAAAAATSPKINVGDADADTESDDDLPTSSGEPVRPPFEQKPSLSGYHNDEIPTYPGKPNLERHISQIPESDGDSSDDDWNDEHEPLGQEKAHSVADRVATAPVVTDEPPIPSEKTIAQMDDQRAEPPQNLPSSLETPGVPKAILATEPLTDPVNTDADIHLATDDDHKDHSILRQVVNPHGKKYDEQGYGTTAHAATVADDSRPKETTESAKLKKKQDTTDATASDEKDRKGIRGFLHKLRHKESKSENKLPETKPSSESKLASHVLTKTGEQTATTTTAPSKEGRDTASPSILPPVDVGPSLGERAGTDGPIGDSEHVSGLDGNPRAESPSSFKRGEAALNDPDDVSSSGVDEEDISRGRGGRLGRLGLGGGQEKGDGKTGPRASGDKNRQNSEGAEDEQYEEARDHFDENLAPPPAFAGQAKSESPVRETRFQEQL